MTTDPGAFWQDFAASRRLLYASTAEARVAVFTAVAQDFVRLIANGLARTAAIDELAEIASENQLDTDQAQAIIAAALKDVREPRGNGHDTAAQPHPLPYVDLLAALKGREWLVPDRIPMFNVTSLSGEGAVGKSIALLQLAVAIVLRRDWFGTLPEFGPVIYLAAEEDGDEIRRRLELIAAYYLATRKDLVDNGLHVLSFAGREAILGRPDRDGVIVSTPLLQRIGDDAERIKPKLIVIDPVADVFAGKEIDRAQSRQFVTLLRGLAMRGTCALILAVHPSLTGINTDTGLSGSTAWHNSVRARLYLKAAEDDPSLRLLEVKKNNYGPVSETIALRFKDGVYIVDRAEMAAGISPANIGLVAQDLFLQLLRRLNAEGRSVTYKPSHNYAPTMFEAQPEAKTRKLNRIHFRGAMEQLFKDKKIASVDFGPPSKLRTKIIEVPSGCELPEGARTGDLFTESDASNEA